MDKEHILLFPNRNTLLYIPSGIIKTVKFEDSVISLDDFPPQEEFEKVLLIRNPVQRLLSLFDSQFWEKDFKNWILKNRPENQSSFKYDTTLRAEYFKNDSESIGLKGSLELMEPRTQNICLQSRVIINRYYMKDLIAGDYI